MVGSGRRLINRVAKIRRHASRWGWMRTAVALVMRVGRRYLGIHIYRVRSRFSETNVPSPCKLSGVENRLITDRELIKAADDPALDLDLDFVREAKARGDLAFGAFDGSTLAGYVWRSLSAAPHTDRLWVRVSPPYSYSYKSFTRLDYRGQRIVPGVILFSDEYMFSRGYTHRVGFIEISNYASVALGKHIDSHWIGYVVYLHWFGRYFQFRTRKVAETGFEFFEIDKD